MFHVGDTSNMLRALLSWKGWPIEMNALGPHNASLIRYSVQGSKVLKLGSWQQIWTIIYSMQLNNFIHSYRDTSLDKLSTHTTFNTSVIFYICVSRLAASHFQKTNAKSKSCCLSNSNCLGWQRYSLSYRKTFHTELNTALVTFTLK